MSSCVKTQGENFFAGGVHFITRGNEVCTSKWSLSFCRLVAEWSLRRHHLTFCNVRGGFTSLPSASSPSPHPHPCPEFLPSDGWQTLVISRYSGPGGSCFPFHRAIVLHVHFYSFQWCATTVCQISIRTDVQPRTNSNPNANLNRDIHKQITDPNVILLQNIDCRLSSIRCGRVLWRQRGMSTDLCQHDGQLRVPLQGGLPLEWQPAHLHTAAQRSVPHSSAFFWGGKGKGHSGTLI